MAWANIRPAPLPEPVLPAHSGIPAIPVQTPRYGSELIAPGQYGAGRVAAAAGRDCAPTSTGQVAEVTDPRLVVPAGRRPWSRDVSLSDHDGAALGAGSNRARNGVSATCSRSTVRSGRRVGDGRAVHPGLASPHQSARGCPLAARCTPPAGSDPAPDQACTETSGAPSDAARSAATSRASSEAGVPSAPARIGPPGGGGVPPSAAYHRDRAARACDERQGRGADEHTGGRIRAEAPDNDHVGCVRAGEQHVEHGAGDDVHPARNGTGTVGGSAISVSQWGRCAGGPPRHAPGPPRCRGRRPGRQPIGRRGAPRRTHRLRRRAAARRRMDRSSPAAAGRRMRHHRAENGGHGYQDQIDLHRRDSSIGEARSPRVVRTLRGPARAHARDVDPTHGRAPYRRFGHLPIQLGPIRERPAASVG